MDELIYKEEAYEIIGACMEVHRELGPGFLEGVYQEALMEEFAAREIPANREAKLEITYKGKILDKHYYADFVCYDKIIVELKAVNELLPEHMAQLFNYLKATGAKLGLLVNCGKSSLEYKRIACTHKFAVNKEDKKRL